GDHDSDPALGGAPVVAQALDDPHARLRHDAYGAHAERQHEDHTDDDRDDDRVHLSLLSRRLTQRHGRAILVGSRNGTARRPSSPPRPPRHRASGPLPPPPPPPRARPLHARAHPCSRYGGGATPS